MYKSSATQITLIHQWREAYQVLPKFAFGSNHRCAVIIHPVLECVIGTDIFINWQNPALTP